MAAAIGFVDAFCARHDVERRDALRLSLLVEELFTNTVLHGHGGDSDAPLRLELQADPARVTLVYADSAPPFDPLAWLPEGAASLEADVGDRPVGRLGVVLISHMAAAASYERLDGWNRLRLELDRQA